MNSEDKKNPPQISIDLSPEVAEGTYANLAIISHSTSEFIFDFARLVPGVPKGNVKSRIILAPEHAKRLLIALQSNIRAYEATNGEIKLQPEKSHKLQGTDFLSTKGEA